MHWGDVLGIGRKVWGVKAYQEFVVIRCSAGAS